MYNPEYENQVWGEPIEGERLSTNAFYTGEQVGSVLQDAKVTGVTAAHGVEAGTVHVGSIAQDAVPDSMPEVKAAEE